MIDNKNGENIIRRNCSHIKQSTTTTFDERTPCLVCNATLMYFRKRIESKSALGAGPCHLELNPTAKCPFNCTVCSYKTRNKPHEELPFEVVESALKDAKDMKVRALYFSGGGEPTAYRDIDKMIMMARAFAKEVSIQTNGYYLNRLSNCLDQVSLITLSLYGHDNESYRVTTGINCFDRLSQNLDRFFKERKGSTKLSAKFLVSPDNYHEVIKMLEFASKYDFDSVHFRCSDSYEDRESDRLSETQREAIIAELSKAPLMDQAKVHGDAFKKQLETTNGRRMNRPSCYITKNGLVAIIEPNGAVFPCVPADGYSKYSLGNVNDNRLLDIWGSKRHQNIAAMLGSPGCHFSGCRHVEQNQGIDDFKKSLFLDNTLLGEQI